MIQADRVHSTPPTNTSATAPQSSRRGFLVQAAGVAAGGAAIGAGLPLPASPAATAQRGDAEADPIFAAIEAHRIAQQAYITAVDAVPSDASAPAARVLVGTGHDGDAIRSEFDGGGFSVAWVPNGKTYPIYAYSDVDIRRNVPKALHGAERETWIAEREEELEAEEKRIAEGYARTEPGKLEAARDEAFDIERDRIWDLILTRPTSTRGISALLSYCREQGSVNELVGVGSWEDALEWTIESALCAIDGLPTPPMSKVVAYLSECDEEAAAS